MQARRKSRGGCLTAFLITVGILALLAVVACMACGFFMVRQQRSYSEPEEIRRLVAEFCDPSLLEGYDPAHGQELNFFFFRMAMAGFERVVFAEETEEPESVHLLVGRFTARFQLDRSDIDATEWAPDPEEHSPPGMELSEAYSVKRIVDGSELEFFVSLYSPVGTETPDSAADAQSPEETSEEPAVPQAPTAPDAELPPGAEDARGEHGEGKVEEPGTGEVAEQTEEEKTGDQAATQAEGKPIIPPDKQGEWVFVSGVRPGQRSAWFAIFMGPRSEWDEEFFVKLLMSMH